MNLQVFIAGGLVLYGTSHYLGWILFVVLGGRSINASAPFINLISVTLTAGLLALAAGLIILSGPFVVQGRRGATGTSYLMLLPLAVIGIIVGALSGSPLLYLASDTVYLCILSFSYLISRHLCMRRPAAEWISLQGTLRASVAVIAIVAGVFALFGRGAPPLFLTLLFAALLLELTTSPSWRYTGLIIVSLLIQLPAMNRAALLQLIFGLAFITMIRRTGLSRTWLRMLPIVVLVLAALALVDLENTRLSRRVSEAASFMSGDQPGGQIAILQRFFEAQVVIETIQAGASIHSVLGFGSGATIDMTSSLDTAVKGSALMGADRVHNIHLLPFAIYYRYGILGVVAIGVLGIRAFRVMVSTLKSDYILMTQPQIVLSSLLLVLSLTNGLFASAHFLTSFMLPIFAAILDTAPIRGAELAQDISVVPG